MLLIISVVHSHICDSLAHLFILSSCSLFSLLPDMYHLQRSALFFSSCQMERFLRQMALYLQLVIKPYYLLAFHRFIIFVKVHYLIKRCSYESFQMWGGVIVWNPQGCLKDDNRPTARHTIPMQVR